MSRVVPPHAADAPPPLPVLLKRLLCAVDFSEASLRAAEFAFSLAQEADARVRLVHVVEADAQDRLGRVVPAGAFDWCEPQTPAAPKAA